MLRREEERKFFSWGVRGELSRKSDGAPVEIVWFNQRDSGVLQLGQHRRAVCENTLGDKIPASVSKEVG